MKKSIIAYSILICCIVLLSACNISSPNSDTIGIEGPAGITGIGESDDTLVQEETFDQGELSVIIIKTLAEYEKFVATCKELPGDFVEAEQLQSFGQFEELLFPAKGYYDYYLYTLKDSTGYMVSVSVKHNPSESAVEAVSFSSETSDFRKLENPNDHSRDYRLGEMTYHYSQGKLRTISWTQNQIRYSISGGAYEIELSEYPYNESSTMLGKLLQANTAQATQNEIIESMK